MRAICFHPGLTVTGAIFSWKNLPLKENGLSEWREQSLWLGVAPGSRGSWGTWHSVAQNREMFSLSLGVLAYCCWGGRVQGGKQDAEQTGLACASPQGALRPTVTVNSQPAGSEGPRLEPPLLPGPPAASSRISATRFIPRCFAVFLVAESCQELRPNETLSFKRSSSCLNGFLLTPSAFWGHGFRETGGAGKVSTVLLYYSHRTIHYPPNAFLLFSRGLSTSCSG